MATASPHPEAAAAIRATDLTRVCGPASAPVAALRGVSLGVGRGERVALLGKSGSAKSTLLHLVGGLDRATAGELEVAGRRLGGRELARYRSATVGMIFQAFHLIASRTAAENVELPMLFAGVAPRERRDRARAALESVGLAARAGHRPAMMSGGEAQRVAVARALANRPPVVLADEPTGNLDSPTAFDLMSRSPAGAREGVYQATLLVDDAKHVQDVVAAAAALGVQARSAVEFIERERLVYLLIFGAMTCVAGVALIVAALGIANTMLMSVLERRREIGIMKAVGADDRHLLLAFLIEGALIGLLGAALGLLLTWAASFPADAWVRSMVQRDLKVDLTESLFVFPAWVVLSVPAFTVLVTTLAALDPARRAARLDPVAALRSE